eukprot:TRINITY_DN376_c0_g1_i3.p1 TRINITY_DN376_c0_g1~~TRINITY_DN376_c0_g1_i3.p1  ORF type:complete len:897 (+),score=219.34 TRINITY_DN376_c0_g1_i3:141-2831(+)
MQLAFKQKLSNGLSAVERVLGTARNPRMADEVEHSYDDKYLLTEFVTGGGLGAVMTDLEVLGLTGDKIQEVLSKAQNRSITLRFDAETTCDFVKKETREVEDPTSHETEVSGAINLKIKNKTVTKITEYYWNLSCTYSLSVYLGSDPNDSFLLLKDSSSTKLKTSTDSSPSPQSSKRDPIEISLSWLLGLLESCKVAFSINRNSKTCFTPRRNPDVEKVLEFGNLLAVWCSKIVSFFEELRNLENRNCDIRSPSTMADGVLIPVIPLLEDVNRNHLLIESGESIGTKTESVLSASDQAMFQEEHRRSLAETISRVQKGSNTDIIKPQAVTLLVTVGVMTNTVRAIEQAVEYVESMLRNQLIAAIGKEVTAVDFRNYMDFHNRKIFAKDFETRPFSYAVRTNDHSPDGFFSIEQVRQESGEIDQPVLSVVKKIEGGSPMKFSLNASSKVTFTGSQYIHSVINYRFSTDVANYNLVASGRQFCGYVMVLGRIGGSDSFLPEHAIIIKDKSTLTIPLLMEEVPSSKQFKSAVESLSPEQQRFAKAYRSMQLESTLFGCCIFELRPQMERVLSLPVDSLIKEIKLTQDLTDLFLTYQISADLLSYQPDLCEDPSDVATAVKIEAVKNNVKAVQEIIQKAKDEELKELERIAEAENYKNRKRAKLSQQYEYVKITVEGKGGKGGKKGGKRNEKSIKSKCKKLVARGFAVSDDEMEDAECDEGLNLEEASACDERSNNEGSVNDEVVDKERPAKSKSIDLSSIPQQLEEKFEKLDPDDALLPTIIRIGTNWTLVSQKSLLSKPVTSSVDQKSEKTRAFDLLDALTRSGALSITNSSLHVVVSSTHCFDKSLMNTVIQDNNNPIESVERSILIAAGVIHNTDVGSILAPDQVERVKSHSPQIF